MVGPAHTNPESEPLPARVAAEPPLEHCREIADWLAHVEHLRRTGENVRFDGSERFSAEHLAHFAGYTNFVWTQYATTLASRGSEAEQRQAANGGELLRRLLFDHPADRIAAYINAASASLRVREQIREALYEGFYSWAHEQKLTAFNPARLLNVLPYLHVQKPNLPDSRIINGYCEYLANPAEGGDIPGAGLDRKMAQQFVRPALRFAEFALQRALNNPASGEHAALTHDSAAGDAAAIDYVLRHLSASVLEDFLFLEHEQHGVSARDRAASAIRRWFLPYLHQHWEGQPPERFESIFGRLDAPATAFSRGYRAELLKLVALPVDDPKRLAEGTAFNRDAILRRYAEFVWEEYARPQSLEMKASPEQSSALLHRLLTVEPHERISKFLARAIDGDPDTDPAARTRREKFTSGLRLLYQWAKGIGLTEYDFDRPEGSWSGFRSALGSGMPQLSLFDGFCDFLGGQVQLGEQFEGRGLKRSTAQNYRRAVARFLEACWNEYLANRTPDSAPPAASSFEEDLAAHLDARIQRYLAEQRAEPEADAPKGLRSMLGIFSDWQRGARTETGKRAEPARQRPSMVPQSETADPGDNGSMTKTEVQPGNRTPAASALAVSLPAGPERTEVTAETAPLQRRVPLDEPRLAAVLQARDLAVDAIVGRGRGTGIADFSQLCRLRMVDFDATRGVLWIPSGPEKRTPVQLDRDQAAAVGEYVRLLQNAPRFRAACIANGRQGPLFLSADGGPLAVREPERALATPAQLAHILTLQDGVITSLIRSAALPFGRLIDFVHPVILMHQSQDVRFTDRRGKQDLVEMAPADFRGLQSFFEELRNSPLSAQSHEGKPQGFVFVGSDGKKLTGDE